jgi:hypothetical protein
MQSRKIKNPRGPDDGGTDTARGESRRAGSPRQVLAVGLVVGTGLYATLFGGAAVAQAPAPVDTDGASPPSSEPAPGDTTEADLLGIGSEDAGSGASADPGTQGDPGTPTDPAGQTDPPPPADPAPDAPAPAAPEAPAPAGPDAVAPSAPAAPAPEAPAAAAPAADSAAAPSHHHATAATRPKPTPSRAHRREKQHDDRRSDRARDARPEAAKQEQDSPPASAPAAPATPAVPTGPAAGSTVFNPPSYLAPLGPLMVGVPSLSIDTFRIPPFLLPIYQAAGVKYGVSWEVLAAINEIETDYGRNLNVSSAGAVGWMQFMPSTWDRYGVDANRDGIKDPYSPVDAIFAAGRYLRAAGAQTDLRQAILAYNHADWYADSVLSRARVIGSLPGDLVDSLTGLAQGRSPLASAGTEAYAAGAGVKLDAVRTRSRASAAVVAVNDGTIARVGHSHRLGRFVQLRDAYGNTYTYGHLTGVGKAHQKPLRAHAHVGGQLLFEIRPGGRGAPRIDPKPILEGWKLLQATGMYRVPGSGHLFGRDGMRRSLLMSRQALAAHVLDDPRVQIYDCGREDIRAGAIDRRVLATLEFLSSSGFSPTVTALKCGHSVMTTSGNVSEHSTGTAVDIAAINGIPIAGHQGAGSITETVVKRLLTLQGAMKPHQIITLMQFPGTDNTFAMADHADHIHIGWRALPGSSTNGGGQASAGVLKPKQWGKLVDRLDHIKTPKVSQLPSKYAIKAVKRGPNGRPRVRVTPLSR